jgi:hypothetical protein
VILVKLIPAESITTDVTRIMLEIAAAGVGVISAFLPSGALSVEDEVVVVEGGEGVAEDDGAFSITAAEAEWDLEFSSLPAP